MNVSRIQLAAGLIAIAGFAAGTLADETPRAPVAAAPAEPAANAPPIAGAELRARLAAKDTDIVVLDVRTPAEFAAGHVPGAINVPHDEIGPRVGELSALRDKEIVLYCRSGRRTVVATEALRKAGFSKLRHLEGDYPAWEAAQNPVER